jgi:glycosyltransferase involved in cell wall biosynthesis
MSSVDVIVPCYGYAHFLNQCVVSVLTQARVDIRVLVIDDASPDNTAEIATGLARRDSRVMYLRHAKNQGHIATYNKGIERASADYYLLLSADDYLLPGVLGRAADIMDRHPEVGFVFGRAVELTEPDTTQLSPPIPTMRDEDDIAIFTGRRFIQMSGARNIVPTPTAVVRTVLQKHVGGYLAELPHTGDMEMWLRLAAHSSVGAIGAPQAVYRKHSGNMSLPYSHVHNRMSELHQHKLAIERFFERCSPILPDSAELYRPMAKQLSIQAIGYASGAFNLGEIRLSEQLSEFALSLCPSVRQTTVWTKFALKRRIGLRGWQTLAPAVQGFRCVAALMRGREGNATHE